eukprot:gene14023-biopygen2040
MRLCCEWCTHGNTLRTDRLFIAACQRLCSPQARVVILLPAHLLFSSGNDTFPCDSAINRETPCAPHFGQLFVRSVPSSPRSAPPTLLPSSAMLRAAPVPHHPTTTTTTRATGNGMCPQGPVRAAD